MACLNSPLTAVRSYMREMRVDRVALSQLRQNLGILHRLRIVSSGRGRQDLCARPTGRREVSPEIVDLQLADETRNQGDKNFSSRNFVAEWSDDQCVAAAIRDHISDLPPRKGNVGFMRPQCEHLCQVCRYRRTDARSSRQP